MTFSSGIISTGHRKHKPQRRGVGSLARQTASLPAAPPSQVHLWEMTPLTRMASALASKMQAESDTDHLRTEALRAFL